MRRDTRNDIICTAEELIRRRGFNAFSYADIARQLQIRNSAIHYYFPIKFDLGRAVIMEELERVVEYRERNAQLTGEQQLKYLVSVFFRNSLLHKICLIGALTPEYATFDEHLQLAVRELCLAILNWVSEFLENGRAQGSLHFEGEAADRANIVISTLSSGLLLHRVLDDDAVFGTTVNRMLEDLGVEWRVAGLRAEMQHLPEASLHSYT